MDDAPLVHYGVRSGDMSSSYNFLLVLVILGQFFLCRRCKVEKNLGRARVAHEELRRGNKLVHEFGKSKAPVEEGFE